jgi:hypothetical protein
MFSEFHLREPQPPPKGSELPWSHTRLLYARYMAVTSVE